MGYCDWDDDHGVSEPDIPWWGIILIYGVAVLGAVVALPLCGLVWLWCKARRVLGA